MQFSIIKERFKSKWLFIICIISVYFFAYFRLIFTIGDG
jgi:hypothetical protein